MAKNSGDFDEDEGFFESLMKRKDSVPMPDSMAKMFKVIIGGGVLLIVAVIAWAVWPNGKKMSDENVPIVRAESGDYKVEPDDKGGMIIPNKDSTIFETMDHDAQPEKKVESLLEDSEQPMKKEQAFVDGTATVPEEKQDAPITVRAGEGDKVVEDVKTEAPVDVAKTETKTDLKVAEVKPVVKEVPKEVAKEVVKAPTPKKVNIIDALKEEAGTAKPKPKDVAVKAALKPTKDAVYIQLAAVKSEADAKAKWAKLKSSYSALSSLSLKIQKADLGAKGTFYRVQAGPTSADNANSICAKIKAAKGACLIVN
jgi:cell division septation protein DedD